MTLRAGPLSGQDLGLLTERSVLLTAKEHFGTFHQDCLVTVAEKSATDFASHVRVRFASGHYATVSHAYFTYIGELQPDGFISAPEGGWADDPFGDDRLVECRFGDGSSDVNESSIWDWQSKHAPIIAFRLAGEAVSLPPVDEYRASLVRHLRGVRGAHGPSPVFDFGWRTGIDEALVALGEPMPDLEQVAKERSASTEAPPVDAGEVGKAVEALTRRADAWSRNDDKCWLSVKLGDLRTLLAALSGSQGSNPKTDLPTEEPSPPVVGDDLVERLEATFPNGGDGEYADLEYVNPEGPEGPEAAARIRELTAALTIAAETFQRYAELHAAKDTEDGRAKARVNGELAATMWRALNGAER